MFLSGFLARVSPDGELSNTIWPPKSKFDPDRDVPDLSGKIFLVTGGNAGCGMQTCKQLLLHGGKVYLAARSEEKAAAAIARLKEETKCGDDKLFFLKLDLGDLPTIRVSAENFLSREKKLDVLINNAGVMVPPKDAFTAQDYDLRTNVLGHYHFTNLIMPALLAAHEATGVPSRVINLSSSAHRRAPKGSGFEPKSLIKGSERDMVLKKWGFMGTATLYGQSKLANMFNSAIVAREHPGAIVSASVHPGGIATELQRHVKTGKLAWLVNALGSLILFPAPMGAYNSLYAAVVAAPDEINGKYIIPWARIGNASEQSKNEKTQMEVQRWMEAQLKAY